MVAQFDRESALAPYRVIDLTQGGCLVCGKILGDLGADVIKVEPPGGDPSRDIGPFYEDTADREKSLFWFAFSANKRGVTLNIETSDGKDIFKRLVKTADFVIESFAPGYLDSLGLGYGATSQVNPRIILTSITPFGQTGPKAGYKASDLTSWAAGGMLYPSGEPDRPPNWISSPQMYLNAGSEAAAASMIAHYYRQMGGEGQWVDVSIQATAVNMLMNAAPFWDLNRIVVPRRGYHLPGPKFPFGLGYACKDGWVTSYVLGGSALGFVSHMRALVQWMEEDGMAPEWTKNFDWVNEMDASKMTKERYQQIEEPFVNFFKTKTKRQLIEGAIERKQILVGPVQTPEDIMDDAQLKAREFWTELDHPDLGRKLTYCGPFGKLSETPCQIRRRAPRIGEHNIEVYEGELGLAREDLLTLKQANVI